ncbi:hypothetical protein CsSME_00017861 [Camellia sinensis var. sinensis]
MEEIGAFAGVQNEYPSFSDMQHVFNRKKLFRRRRNFEDGLRRIRKRDFEILSIVRNHLDEKGLAGRVVEWFDVVLMYEDCQKHADWYCQKGLVDHPKYHTLLRQSWILKMIMLLQLKIRI